MSRIIISVRNQTLRMVPGNTAIVSGSQDFVRFHFELDVDWVELTSFAQFTQNNTSYNLYLDDNYDVYMPPEIVEGTCTLMLYGTGQVADRPAIIGTTNYLTFTIDKNHLVEDASSTEITEPLYSQLLKKMEELLDNQISEYPVLPSSPTSGDIFQVERSRDSYQIDYDALAEAILKRSYANLPNTNSVSTSDLVAVDINGTKYKATLQVISNAIGGGGGGGGSQRTALTYYTKNFGTITELPVTFTDANITADMIPIKVSFGNEDAPTWVWQAVCADGSVTIQVRPDVPSGNSGINGTTTLEIEFGLSFAAAPTLLTNLSTSTPANILQSEPRPGVTGVLPVANGGTGATTAGGALENLGVDVDVSKLSESLAVIIDGNTTTTYIAKGQYAYVKNAVIAEGLYVANSNIPIGTTVTAQQTYLTPVSGGGLNAIQDSISSTQIDISKVQEGLAIIVNGDTAPMAVPIGGYAYIKNNAHGLADGLYVNVSSAAFPVSGGVASSTVFASPDIGVLNLPGETRIKFGIVATSDMQTIYVSGGTGRYKDITFDGFASAPVIMVTLNNNNYNTYGAVPVIVSNVTATSARILTTLDVNSSDLSVMWVAIGETEKIIYVGGEEEVVSEPAMG